MKTIVASKLVPMIDEVYAPAPGGVRRVWGPASDFGAYLLHQREQNHLSLRVAARVLGISHTHLHNLEHYDLGSPPKLEFLHRIASLYRVPTKEVEDAAGYRYEVDADLFDVTVNWKARACKGLLRSYSSDLFGDFENIPPVLYNLLIAFAKAVEAEALAGGTPVTTRVAQALAPPKK